MMRVLLALLVCAAPSCKRGASAAEPSSATTHDGPIPGNDSRTTTPSTEPAASATTLSTNAATPRLAPLAAESELIALAVAGYRDAVVSVPLGATSKKPVLVALHGNYDRPEWQCEVWRGLVGASGFILCPRGIPRAGAPKSEDRWEYGSGKKTESELEAGLAALVQRFGEYVDAGPIVFTGFSLGAILGVHIVQHTPARFSRVVLTEGGQGGWNARMARAFKAGGGERVLFACGQTGCAQSSRALAKMLEKNDVPARVAPGGNIGHTYDGAVAKAISENWTWLVEGDARWEK
jgi:dienelactone hydrolase